MVTNAFRFPPGSARAIARAIPTRTHSRTPARRISSSGHSAIASRTRSRFIPTRALHSSKVWRRKFHSPASPRASGPKKSGGFADCSTAQAAREVFDEQRIERTLVLEVRNVADAGHRDELRVGQQGGEVLAL